ncbi:MAG: DUF2235 domain-containing protein [Cyclobacteriaceae bacterium]|nr:DUF2235 domain-containing protein [Cyclobacteriaceae bacterium]
MKKRIVICADGTWSRPEIDPKVDFPTNVLKIARAIQPVANDQIPQQVFYDWGIGSYHNQVIGGATGRGIHKNIMDNYRYIVQNYSPGDDLYFFGFSRGAYTVRCLSGLIYNCGILKRPDEPLIQKAFDHYKRSGAAYAPGGEESIKFRAAHSHESRDVKFIGVWDTVGALGIPLSFLGMFEDKDEFYDTKIGRNVLIARHALAIDEHRADFEATIWNKKDNLDIKQVWFAGAHSDIGGSYKPDANGSSLSDNALGWMIREAQKADLTIEQHLHQNIRQNPMATLHEARRSYFRVKKIYFRPIDHGKDSVFLHESVKKRWEMDPGYRPKNLSEYLEKNGWPDNLEQ